MQDEQSSSKKQKAAPKPEMATKADIERIEAAISKIAVMAGQGNILKEFNISRWTPSAKDTKRQW